MISSTSNQKVKQAAALAKKAKYRTETGLFVVEGPKMAAELPDDRIQQVYVTEHFLEEEKNHIIARITVILSGLMLAGWIITIIMGIRG